MTLAERESWLSKVTYSSFRYWGALVNQSFQRWHLLFHVSVLAFGILACGTASAEIVGITYTGSASGGSVVSIDETTGEVTTLGSSGIIFANSLARSPNGVIYTIGRASDSVTYRLYSVDHSTGAGTPGPSVTLPGTSPDADALAFSPSGTLHAMDLNDNLYTVDVSTGVGTFLSHVGVLGQPIGINGMAFAADGTLYGWGVERFGLIRINPTTGAFTDVSSTAGAGAFIQGLAFGSDGTLYGARTALWRINTATGVATSLAADPLGDIRGIVFVPEPSSLLLVGWGSLLLLFVQQRQRLVGARAH